MRQQEGDLSSARAAGAVVRVLGPFEVRRGDAVATIPFSSQRVLAFLAVHDRPLRRAYVAGALWGDASEDQALANLRSAVWRLRQDWSSLVRATKTTIALAPDVDVDLRGHRTWISGVLGGDPASFDQPLLLSDGELLVGWYEDWVIAEREQHRQAWFHALEAACEHLAESGRHFAAVEAGMAAVSGDPLRESAQRALIRAHLAEGNYAEAMRRYQSFRRLLRDALSLDPSPLMEQLVSSLVAR